MLSFLDLDTGKVETVSKDLLREAEESDEDEEPDLPAWQEEEWEIAKRIASTDRFLKFPIKSDVHEWSIMEAFSYSVESDRIREELLNALHGAGAFRYFKDTRCGRQTCLRHDPAGQSRFKLSSTAARAA
jgi:hypothetical protein